MDLITEKYFKAIIKIWWIAVIYNGKFCDGSCLQVINSMLYIMMKRGRWKQLYLTEPLLQKIRIAMPAVAIARPTINLNLVISFGKVSMVRLQKFTPTRWGRRLCCSPCHLRMYRLEEAYDNHKMFLAVRPFVKRHRKVLVELKLEKWIMQTMGKILWLNTTKNGNFRKGVESTFYATRTGQQENNSTLDEGVQLLSMSTCSPHTLKGDTWTKLQTDKRTWYRYIIRWSGNGTILPQALVCYAGLQQFKNEAFH